MKEQKDDRSLEIALASIEKKYGKGAIMKLDDDSFNFDTESISTGSLSLDLATGIMGIPKGRITEIFGAESSGKTSLTYSTIKQCQLKGGRAAFVDAEHAFDYIYAKKTGINTKELYISQPDYGEQALDIVQTLIESNEFDLIVIDSVAALTPKAEIDGEMEDTHIGRQARMMGQAMRKLSAVINRTNTCVIFTNQTRMKIGVMFGSPVTTPGGKALKFYSSMRIKLNRIKTLKQGEDCIGTRIKAKIAKSKVSPPFKTAEFEIYFDEGVSTASDVLTMGLTHGIIDQKGRTFSFKDEKLGVGRDLVRIFLKDHPDYIARIQKQILNLLGGKE